MEIENNDNENKRKCLICNKIYSSTNSLYNHNRKCHNLNETKKKNKEDNSYHCKYCNKGYLIAQSRWAHQKKCKIQNENEESSSHLILQPIKIEIDKIKEDYEKQKQQILELQQKLLNCKKLDNKTFKSVNKILMNRSYTNSNNRNLTNSNNTINNTYQILSLGNEDLINVLTIEQKKQIMNSRLCSLEKIVEITHCGIMNQFKNIIITNLKDDYAYRYDENKGYS